MANQISPLIRKYKGKKIYCQYVWTTEFWCNVLINVLHNDRWYMKSWFLCTTGPENRLETPKKNTGGT